MKVSAKLQTARQMQQDIVLNRTLQEIEKASNILFLKLNNTSYTETAKLLNYLKFFFVVTPGLMKGDTGGFTNENYLSNPVCWNQ